MVGLNIALDFLSNFDIGETGVADVRQDNDNSLSCEISEQDFPEFVSMVREHPYYSKLIRRVTANRLELAERYRIQGVWGYLRYIFRPDEYGVRFNIAVLSLEYHDPSGRFFRVNTFEVLNTLKNQDANEIAG